MKTIGLASIRNDVDIVESWVRHHVERLDHLHVIVHSPEDGTDEVLKALAAEGLPLTLTFHSDPAFAQNDFMNTLARSLEPAYAFLLDADEFVRQSRDEIERELSADRFDGPAAFALLQTYPNIDSPAETTIADPICRMRYRLPTEARTTKLVLTPMWWRTSACISQGNHYLHDWFARIPDTTIRFAHFPCRSNAQVLNKIIIGTLAKNFSRPELIGGTHWDQAFRRLVDGDETPPIELFHGRQSIENLVYDPLPEHVLKYTDLARQDPYRALARFAAKLVNA